MICIDRPVAASATTGKLGHFPQVLITNYGIDKPYLSSGLERERGKLQSLQPTHTSTHDSHFFAHTQRGCKMGRGMVCQSANRLTTQNRSASTGKTGDMVIVTKDPPRKDPPIFYNNRPRPVCIGIPGIDVCGLWIASLQVC